MDSIGNHQFNTPWQPHTAIDVLYCAAFMQRVPFQATVAARPYDAIRPLPVTVLLDNVRSLYNVGAFFRTADAAGIEKLYLCGITGQPPKRAISKTALGAEETVRWEHFWDPLPAARQLRELGYEIAAVETTVHAVDLFDWRPRFPVCVLFGHEIEGIRPELAALSDTHVRIPMLGKKHSLNVATAGGVVIYELLRKYRNLMPALR
jgi:23S rRNA (guanosine2251-2'-O)-methyltransferase